MGGKLIYPNHFTFCHTSKSRLVFSLCTSKHSLPWSFKPASLIAASIQPAKRISEQLGAVGEPLCKHLPFSAHSTCEASKRTWIYAKHESSRYSKHDKPGSQSAFLTKYLTSPKNRCRSPLVKPHIKRFNCLLFDRFCSLALCGWVFGAQLHIQNEAENIWKFITQCCAAIFH